jgi:hypothetical protein
VLCQVACRRVVVSDLSFGIGTLEDMQWTTQKQSSKLNIAVAPNRLCSFFVCNLCFLDRIVLCKWYFDETSLTVFWLLGDMEHQYILGNLFWIVFLANAINLRGGYFTTMFSCIRNQLRSDSLSLFKSISFGTSWINEILFLCRICRALTYIHV